MFSDEQQAKVCLENPAQEKKYGRGFGPLMGAINCGEPDISRNHASNNEHLILWVVMGFGADHKHFNLKSIFLTS